jgi:lipopolysaccharide transport system ATP-binding protein
MGNIAVKVENLGKMYRIGGPQEAYQTFRDAITKAVSAPFKRARDLLRGQAYGAAGLTEEIWALKDVSFEVKHGEVVGIIGRNGAGKSTLLKILSRITEPTTGYADVYGRVGALLEVGTGFHPELTGRENVYLNGAILGMSRNDINRKFDEIVEFAGVEKFIDTPVKHYSSGMGLRLGFSVAAHLEPDILVVDEVLAVGDAQFQKKCLGKMSDVAGEGRTVLFVSHNMTAVNNLCGRGILLESGSIKGDLSAQEAIQLYHQSYTQFLSTTSLRDFTSRMGTGELRFTEVEYRDVDGNPTIGAVCGETVQIALKYERKERSLPSVDVAIKVADMLGNHKLVFASTETMSKMRDLDNEGEFVLVVPRWPLKPGDYTIDLRAHNHNQIIDGINGCAALRTLPGDYYGTGVSYWSENTVLYEHSWLASQCSSATRKSLDNTLASDFGS